MTRAASVNPTDITLGQISDLGIVVLMIAIFFAGMRGDWVFGWVHREMVERMAADNARLRDENQRYVNLALNGALLANKAITLAESPQNDNHPPALVDRKGGD